MYVALSTLGLLAMLQLFGKGSAIAKGTTIAALCVVGFAVAVPSVKPSVSIALIAVLLLIAVFYSVRDYVVRGPRGTAK